MDRREFLSAAALGLGSLALVGCGSTARRAASRSRTTRTSPAIATSSESRLLNRIGYGPNSRDLELLQKGGKEGFVREQLRANQEEDWALKAQIGSLDIFRASSAELADVGEDESLRQLQQAAILRAVYSPNQLLERMADFWSNHFSIYARKVNGALRKPQDEISVVRAHALGKFPDLLRASAHSPAMLAFLDNTSNRNGVVNENYARELMELHTLGVHGGYTQRDVLEVARCFTGWTIENRFLRARGRFRFDPERHDDGEKLVLGHTIPAGGGKKDGDLVLDILAKHPSTARFVAGKLCRYFLGDSAQRWIDPTATIYLATGGDIREMLTPMLMSDRLLDGPPIVKRPFDLIVSSLRRLEAETDGGKPLQRHLEALGQPLYQWPMPDGYPDKTSAWTGSMLARWNFAQALVEGRIDGTRVEPRFLGLNERSSRSSVKLVLDRDPAGQTGVDGVIERDAEAMSAMQTLGLCLMSPEFQWR